MTLRPGARGLAPPLVAGVLAALLAAVLVAVPATPSYAVVSATFGITARCDGLGKPDAGVRLTGEFGGLFPIYAGYAVVAYHDLETEDAVTVVTDSWNAAADGSYVLDEFAFAYGPQAGIEVAAGDGFHWELHRTYGIDEIIASGDIAASGPACTGEPPPPPPPSPPAKANLSASPAQIRVGTTGKFAYPFKGPAGVHGTIRITAGSAVWGSRPVTLSSKGAAKPAFKLSKARLKALRKLGTKKLVVTVVLTNKGGKSTAARKLTLKRPKA